MYREADGYARKRPAHAAKAAGTGFFKLGVASLFSLVLALVMSVSLTWAVPEQRTVATGNQLALAETVPASTADAVEPDVALARDALSRSGIPTTMVSKPKTASSESFDAGFSDEVGDIPADEPADMATPAESASQLPSEGEPGAPTEGADDLEQNVPVETDSLLIEVHDIAILPDCNIFVVGSQTQAEAPRASQGLVARVESGRVVSAYSAKNLNQTALGVRSPLARNLDEIIVDSPEKCEEAALAVEAMTGEKISYYAQGNLDTYLGADWMMAKDELPFAIRARLVDSADHSGTVIDDNMWFDQKKYPGQYYQGAYDIPTYGCGLCSTTNSINMLFNLRYEPPEVARLMETWADEHGGIQYCVEEGTAYDGWAEVVSAVFGVDVRQATSIEDVKDSLAAGSMVVSGHDGQFKDGRGEPYENGGHIICFYKTDGSSVWAKDSGGEHGGSCIEYTAEEFEQYWCGSGYRTYIISRPVVE